MGGLDIVKLFLGHDTSNGYYYAMAEAYGIGAEHVAVVSTDPRDGQGRPLIGHSNLNARIWLSGAPPPPRPSTWQQKSYLDGKHCIVFDEVQTPAGLDWASALSQTGLMGYNPPTQGYAFEKSWHPEDGVHRQYVAQKYLIDPDWVNRTTQDQYRAAWVYAGATAGVQAQGGKIRSQVGTCAISWGILHNP